MSQETPQRTNWAPVLILGSVWGLSEAAMGMALRQCASTVSGSVMTGAALLFLAAAWAISPRAKTIAAVAGVAVVFKLFDALLLGLPILHGAIGNPIFAIVMEGAAFLLIVSVVSKAVFGKAAGQGLAGGLAALVAVNVFPLVKYATGVAACATGTGYPLSLYYAPIAVALAALTVPLGLRAGAAVAGLELRPASLRWLSPATMALSLGALALMRLL
ncbi:MAG: hypothetical protein JW775_09840 [Candidatus Aminicenantes bacterium]|nr:hypothetical protein [Candidatus Aminicenantes bacterium]